MLLIHEDNYPLNKCPPERIGFILSKDTEKMCNLETKGKLNRFLKSSTYYYILLLCSSSSSSNDDNDNDNNIKGVWAKGDHQPEMTCC